MKKLYKILTLALFSFLILNSTFLIRNCICQWQPDVRLSNYPDTSNNYDPDGLIASNGNLVHTVWYDTRDGNKEIYYKRSTNGGVNWEQDTRLTNDPAISYNPSIAVSGLNVHITWNDTRDGYYEIYYKNSTDGGITWGADTRMTVHTTGSAAYPYIAVSGLFVHVCWFDTRDGNNEIYYKRSTDAGLFWGADTRLTNNPYFSYLPVIALSGSDVHIVWYDFRDGNYEIYYKRSTDAGLTWSTDTRLTNDIAISSYPTVAVSGSDLHIVWCDNRDGNYEIYYKRSTDGGSTWGADTRLTNDYAVSNSPVVAVSGSNVHVVWYDNRDGNYEIYYKLSTDGGVIWGADTRLTNDPATSRYPCISISSSVLHVVWSDMRDGIWEIYYKRNPLGNPTGIVHINTEIPKEYKLLQNYPNPFNPTTKIKFEIPNSKSETNSKTEIRIYDVLGKEITVLVNENLRPGSYEVQWDASNYPSGVYFYKLTARQAGSSTGDFVQTKSMILIK